MLDNSYEYVKFGKGSILDEEAAHDLDRMAFDYMRLEHSHLGTYGQQTLEIFSGEALQIIGTPERLRAVCRSDRIFDYLVIRDDCYGAAVCTKTTSRPGLSQMKKVANWSIRQPKRSPKTFFFGGHIKNTMAPSISKKLTALTRIQIFNLELGGRPRSDILFTIQGDRSVPGSEFLMQFRTKSSF